MWYYIFLTFIILGCLVFARINSAYHPDLLIKKYIIVRSEKLQKLFISQTNPLDMKTYNRKKYRNKFTVFGLVFYALWTVLVVFSIVFLILGPQTAIEPFEFDDRFFISTLNKAVVFMLSMIFLGFEMSFYFLNIFKSPSVNENKFVRVIWYIVTAVVFLISVAGVVETVKMLV